MEPVSIGQSKKQPRGCVSSLGASPWGEGEIFLGEQEVSGVPTHKRGAVVMFQDLRMFPHMTAVENVAFPLKIQLVQYDTPEAVYTQPATRQAADYFGDCVYLPGKVSGGRFRSRFADLPAFCQ